MTTKVTIEVPEHADYRVAIVTSVHKDAPDTVSHLNAGERTEVYIHDGLRIVGIIEVPAAS